MITKRLFGPHELHKFAAFIVENANQPAYRNEALCGHIVGHYGDVAIIQLSSSFTNRNATRVAELKRILNYPEHAFFAQLPNDAMCLRAHYAYWMSGPYDPINAYVQYSLIPPFTLNTNPNPYSHKCLTCNYPARKSGKLAICSNAKCASTRTYLKSIRNQ